MKKCLPLLASGMLLCIVIYSCKNPNKLQTTAGVDTTSLKITLPEQGRLVNDKLIGNNWVNLLVSLNDWTAEKPYWQLKDGVLNGDYNGGLEWRKSLPHAKSATLREPP